MKMLHFTIKQSHQEEPEKEELAMLASLQPEEGACYPAMKKCPLWKVHNQLSCVVSVN